MVVCERQNCKNKKASIATRLAVLGVLTALLEAIKWALNVLPNVELVTLLCALYGFCFGPISVVSVGLFVVIETLWWGINTWVLEYFIHFPLICLMFAFFKKLGINKIWVFTLFAVLITISFGFFTSFVDVVIPVGFYDFPKRYVVYYMRGILFYIVHVVCNFVVFSILFRPIEKLFTRLIEAIGF